MDAELVADQERQRNEEIEDDMDEPQEALLEPAAEEDDDDDEDDPADDEDDVDVDMDGDVDVDVDADNDPEDDENEDNDVIDGGVAGQPSGELLSTSCNMYLIFEFKEFLPFSLVPKDCSINALANENNDGGSSGNGNDNSSEAVPHPIYQPGSKVQIGLEKNTKLSAVFARYCEFANQYLTTKHKNNKIRPLRVKPSDLEFSQCAILSPSEIAETSALMKKDKISVRKIREDQRKEKASFVKLQRDSDREYFNQMRNLMPDKNLAIKTDVVFHCRGKMKDVEGYKQEVLTTYVKGHSSILTKRSKWLALKIDAAKGDFFGANVPAGHDDDGEGANAIHEDLVFEANQNQNPNNNNNQINGGGDNARGSNNLVPIVDDEEDEHDNENLVHSIHDSVDGGGTFTDSSLELDNSDTNRGNINRIRNAGSPVIPYVGGNFPDTLRVPLSHPPEAVKLLLEYCYTNRVIALGSKAFRISYKPIDTQQADPLLIDLMGPVSPFSKPLGLRANWPKGGKPTISLSIALAGIQLAEEANIPRLSLMCEIAASQLVSANTALEALALCEQQFRETGNRLTHLRKSVMLYFVLGRGPKGVSDLYNMSSFKRTLKEKSEDVVPSLLMGVMETVKHVLGEKDLVDSSFDTVRFSDTDYNRKSSNRKKSMAMYLKVRDENDTISRSHERNKWRQERWNKRPRINLQERNPYGLETEDSFQKSKASASIFSSAADGVFVYKGGAGGSGGDTGRTGNSSRRHRESRRYSGGPYRDKNSRSRRRSR